MFNISLFKKFISPNTFFKRFFKNGDSSSNETIVKSLLELPSHSFKLCFLIFKSLMTSNLTLQLLKIS